MRPLITHTGFFFFFAALTATHLPRTFFMPFGVQTCFPGTFGQTSGFGDVVDVRAAAGVGVRVGVAVGVAVGAAVGVDVTAGVAVGLGVPVAVGVGVGVAVGVPTVWFVQNSNVWFEMPPATIVTTAVRIAASTETSRFSSAELRAVQVTSCAPS